MHYQDFQKIAKEYNKVFGYSLRKESFKSRLFWVVAASFLTTITLMTSSIIGLPSFMPGIYALAGGVLFEIITIILYAYFLEEQKKAKLISLGVFSIETDNERLPLEVRGDWLRSRIPYSRDHYLDLVEGFEKLDARLNIKKSSTYFFENYIQGIINWTNKTKSIATLIFIPTAIFITQAVLENKPWTKTIKLYLTTENVGLAGLLLLALVVISIVLAFLASMIKLAFDYWLDVMTPHGVSDVSVTRLTQDLLRLSKINVLPTATDSNQIELNM